MERAKIAVCRAGNSAQKMRRPPPGSLHRSSPLQQLPRVTLPCALLRPSPWQQLLLQRQQGLRHLPLPHLRLRQAVYCRRGKARGPSMWTGRRRKSQQQ